ncbi:MAG: biosynthetic-type acetolactate synthase large subunit [Armatimonadetes bacterium]|nr:biosynthetic-type acetolactate synthase large subunit [Armatimonadota bacterium]
MSGALAVLKALQEENVDTIFGYPGGQVIPLFDAIYDFPIQLVLPRHEQGAGHMADGYARSTGKVGVCMATSGPGATNLVTALATAYMDSIPVVAFTGQVPRAAIGRDSFQEADTTGITIPVTKHNYLVTEEADLVNIIREAFYVASTGRPGPVLIDLPSDIQRADVPYPERHIEGLDGYHPPALPRDADIEQAADLINSAERPLLYIGGGALAAGASDLVTQLADTCNLGVVHTLMGKGAYPESRDLSMGMPGMHGMGYANWALHECDVMVVIGARFDDRVTGNLKLFSPGTKVIHIDVDAAEIDKIRHADVAIVTDARTALEALVPLCKPRARTAWEEMLLQKKQEMPLSYNWNKDGMPPQFVVEKLREIAGDDAIISTEVGQNQMWAAQFYPIEKPRHFLSSGGLGTMGYGFPAAIGAQFGNPSNLVVDIAGDGSIQMNIQEMATARHHELPVKVVILNNCFLGMVRQWQDLFYDKRYSSVALCGLPDFTKLAEAYDSVGFETANPDEVQGILEQALEINDRPVLMNFHVAKEENVYPMIPAGKSIHDMMLKETLSD